MSGALGRPKPPPPPPGGRPPPKPPPPMGRFGSCSENAERMKTLSPQTTGCAQPRPRTLAVHFTFLSADHSAGRPFSALRPVPPVPRNCGHSSPLPTPGRPASATTRPNRMLVRIASPFNPREVWLESINRRRLAGRESDHHTGWFTLSPGPESVRQQAGGGERHE